MIAYLKGEVVEIEEEKLILECGDIGYNISMPASALDGTLRPGQEVKIHTHLHVREDAMQLYGFLTRDDLKMFRMLLGVSGIGPKAALGILSGLSADELRFAVLSDDIKTISQAPGVGKKTAQKMILELKDKLAKGQMAAGGEPYGGTGVTIIPENKSTEAAAALAVLGYTSAEVAQALKGVDVETLSLEEIIRQCLKKMVK